MTRRTLYLTRRGGGGLEPAYETSAVEQPHPEVLRGIDNIGALRVSGTAAAGGGGLRPVRLPLRLRAFDRLPLIVSARLHGASGRAVELFGRIYLAADT